MAGVKPPFQALVHGWLRSFERGRAALRQWRRPSSRSLDWSSGSGSVPRGPVQQDPGAFRRGGVADGLVVVSQALDQLVGAVQQGQELRERRALERAATPLLPCDLLGRGGWALLGLFAARVATSMLPFQIYAPEWYVRLGGELINTSPVLLTGFVLLLGAALINRQEELNRLPRLRVMVWLLQAALSVYLLVIPMQVCATVFVLQRAEARLAIQWSWVQGELAAAQQRQASPKDLRQLGELRDRLQEQRNRGQRQLRFNLMRELLRVCASAVVVVWALRLPLGGLQSDAPPVH